MTGSFCVFEGIDGAGKSTLAESVAAFLENTGRRATVVNRKDCQLDVPEFVSRKVKNVEEFLWNCIDGDPHSQVPASCWIYMTAVWFKLISKHIIKPKVDSGEIVICDSWIYKRLARFLLIDEVDHRHIADCFSELSVPDLVFLLDLPASETWKRRSRHPLKDMGFLLDTQPAAPKQSFINYQEKIRRILLTFSETENWKTLDGMQPKSSFTTQIAEELLRLPTTSSTTIFSEGLVFGTKRGPARDSSLDSTLNKEGIRKGLTGYPHLLHSFEAGH